MRLREINDQIAQTVKEYSLFDPTTKRMITYKTLEPYMDQKLKNELKKQHIKNTSVWHTSIQSTLDYDYDFTKLKEITCKIYHKENFKLKTDEIKDIIISYGKYNNETFYRIFVVTKDFIHKTSIKLNEKTIKEITHFYPEMMSLFTEGMALYDDRTSQSLQIMTNINFITFKAYETLPNVLQTCS